MHANLLQLSKKIRVGAVSYLNTKPLLYGLQQHAVYESIELIEDYPANLAKALQDNTIDIGLVPVAVTEKVVFPFAQIAELLGKAVIEIGLFTVNVAADEVALPQLPVTTH